VNAHYAQVVAAARRPEDAVLRRTTEARVGASAVLNAVAGAGGVGVEAGFVPEGDCGIVAGSVCRVDATRDCHGPGLAIGIVGQPSTPSPAVQAL
jgi:hypothetical protein